MTILKPAVAMLGIIIGAAAAENVQAADTVNNTGNDTVTATETIGEATLQVHEDSIIR